MHLSENEGIEGVRFAVTGGQGFVSAALCLELIRRGALQVCSLDDSTCVSAPLGPSSSSTSASASSKAMREVDGHG
uniref:3-beta hydroxysteroid dehydrogenase/isomerase domain-containing protein n=1 Tax=Aegilops tauschii subsp. strangulata TaxID=200361 RepID=A0A453HVE9_AEGTS